MYLDLDETLNSFTNHMELLYNYSERQRRKKYRAKKESNSKRYAVSVNHKTADREEFVSSPQIADHSMDLFKRQKSKKIRAYKRVFESDDGIGIKRPINFATLTSTMGPLSHETAYTKVLRSVVLRIMRTLNRC